MTRGPAYLSNPHDHPIWQELVDELDSAMTKSGPMASPHEGWAVIREELEPELWAHVVGILDLCSTPTTETSAPRPEQSLDALRALSDAAAPGPWQWLNGGDEHSDELQDGDGEEIARGFREDIEFTLNRDGSFAAAAANYVRSLLSETKP